MNTFYVLILFIEWVLIIYIGISVLYLFIFALGGLFAYKSIENFNEKLKKIIIYIPAYQEDNVIINVIKEALSQNYPKELFKICVIADKMKDETISELNKYNIETISVNFENSTKSKALNFALSQTKDNSYEIALILDADNIMESDFLRKISGSFRSSYPVIQGHRTAKNKNTAFAILDAVSEEINNHIFRKGHRALGLSSALIGSAIAIDFELFKKIMPEINAIGGFDKELELLLLKNNIKIEYLDNAIVFDEKIQNSKSFSTQRKRWLSAQYYYFKKFLPDATIHLFKNANLNYFNKALQMFFLPRVLLLGISFIFACVTLFINPILISVFWFSIFSLITLSILFSIPKSLYNIKFIYALFSIPMAFITLFLLLFKIKSANKTFIHTQHSITNNKSDKL